MQAVWGERAKEKFFQNPALKCAIIPKSFSRKMQIQGFLVQNCENRRGPYFFFSEDVLKYCYAIMDSLQPEASITTTFFKEECVL
jgi:hypothetical protein